MLLGLLATVPSGASPVGLEAQDSQGSVPRVGLVLGGGGARGIAHLGVLKVLDEVGLRVDYVTGTSMGAVVGGLYASGMDVDRLEEELLSVDWAELFRTDPPRRELSFRRKQDDANFPVQAEVGLGRRGLRFPRGLVSDQKLDLALQRLTLPVAAIRDFDELPISFRAIATDLETGLPVILARGSLAEALRASTSVPGAFAPVEVDGRFLVDGGVTRNLPVDVARAMGADVIVAVDVGSPLDPGTELESAVDVTNQIVTIQTRVNSDRQLEHLRPGQDVVIIPDMPDLRASSFGRAREAFDAGLAAGRSVESELRRLAAAQAGSEATPRRAVRRETPPRIDYVRIENRSGLSSGMIRRRIRARVGEPLDVDALQVDLEQVYGLGVFERVGYRLETSTQGTGLVVQAVQKPWGPSFLRFGLGLADDLGGNSSFDLLLSYTLTQLNRYGAELRNEFQLGGDRRAFSELYQPFGTAGRLFLSPRVEYRREVLDVNEGRTRVAQYRLTRGSVALDAGMPLGRSGELRAGMLFGRVEADPRVGTPDLTGFDEDTGAYLVRLSIDRVDDRSFPRYGQLLTVEYLGSREGLGASRRYDRLEARGLQATGFGRFTLLARFEAGTSLGTDLPLWDEFALGGFLRLSGLRERQIPGRYKGLGQLTLYRRVATLPTAFTGGHLFVGASLEAGNAWRQAAEVRVDDLEVNGALLMGLETLLGPLYLAYGRGEGGQDSWYLFLGRNFF